MFMENSCRNDWDGLNPNALNIIFSGLRVGNVTPKDIPNVTMKSLYDEYLKIWDVKCEVLSNCLDEQLQCRVLRALPVTEAPENTPPPVADLDCSDMNVLTVAKDLLKIWVAGMGKRKTLPMVDCLGREARE